MRTPQHDPELTPDTIAPERRCILSGTHDARDALIRLALSPDGVLVPDVMARAPGRGAWIGVDRAALTTAIAKGKIKGALARAFKGEAVRLVDDLPAAIEASLRREFLSLLGLATKSGVLVTGAERVDAAARGGAVYLLAHAADAADDGRRKRDQSWRVGEDAEGSGKAGRVLPVDRITLAGALGRDVVHLAIIDDGWAQRIGQLLDRWQRYAGCATGEPAAPDEKTEFDPTAHPAGGADAAA